MRSLPPITAYLALGAVNEPLKLWSGTTGFDWGEGLKKCATTVLFSWIDGAIVFELAHPGHQSVMMRGGWAIESDDGLRFKASWRGTYGVEAGAVVKGFAWDIHQVGDDETSLVAVNFLLPNMHDDFSTESVSFETAANGPQSVRRLTLEADDWRITVDRVFSAPKQREEVQQTGGWAVTHVGRIEKTSGETFNVKAARNVLKGLTLFFSFARGQWVAPLFPRGFDENDMVCWNEFKAARVARWEQGATWQREPGRVAKSAFPGFFRLFYREDRRTSVGLAVDWFVQSNSQDRGIDASLVSAFTGLDLMAWNLLVDDRRLISERGFDKLDGDDRIRLLLKTLGLDFDIPDEYRDLKAFCEDEFADALAMIRNSLVHPTLKNRRRLSSLSTAGKRQAWLFAMRVLEIGILLWWECDTGTFDFTWHDWRAAPWYPE